MQIKDVVDYLKRRTPESYTNIGLTVDIYPHKGTVVTWRIYDPIRGKGWEDEDLETLMAKIRALDDAGPQPEVLERQLNTDSKSIL